MTVRLRRCQANQANICYFSGKKKQFARHFKGLKRAAEKRQTNATHH